jgi:hypothetical protein
MGMKNKIALSLAAGLLLGAPPQARAHHSAAAFNTQQEMKITGTVSSYQFKNPHVYLTVKVRNADGTTSNVQVEAGAASVLNGLGFTKDSVRVGETVTITGNPGRNNPNTLMLGRELTRADGQYIPLNIASRSVYAGKTATATSIAGTWFPPRTEFNRFLGGQRGWAITDKGKAASSNVDPKATTQKDCVPIGAPAVMFYPVASTVEVQKDRVVLKVDWMETERVIHLDGRKHPPATQTFLHGHSIGRWEGDTLVAETTNFREHAMGLSMSLPSSSQKRLTERFRLSPDKTKLLYSGTVEDPVFLSKPLEWSGEWEYRPGMKHSSQKCDLNVARQFLND